MECLHFTYPIEFPSVQTVKQDVRDTQNNQEISFCIPEDADYQVIVKATGREKQRIYYMKTMFLPSDYL